MHGLGGLGIGVKALQSGRAALIEGFLLGAGLLQGLRVWSERVLLLADGRRRGLQPGASQVAAALYTADHLVAYHRAHRGA
ncbi:hypothetical protein DAT35_14825 [Vitiosangium sp. GDMCC 1.1324]|nr:hypothetical protein DAT35_14825 [Vitiosangium sp. GDMCC 1.1324]